MDTLKHAVEQSKNDEFRKGLDEVMSRVKSENLVARSDIKEYATRQVNYTMADKERMRNERKFGQNQVDIQTETFKSRNNTFNDNASARQIGQEKRQQNRPKQQNFEGEQGGNQRNDANRTQSNSPKNRRQYLE